MLATVVLASLLVMLASLSGKLATWRSAGALIERNLHFFVSFAAGVLLVVAFNLSQEVIEHAGSLSAGLPWIAIGALVVLVAFRYVPHFHHHHERGDHVHTEIDANRVLASDALHNITDGAVIVVSFLASPAIGIASTISIMVHESLQETSEFFVLREAGLSVRRTLLWNFLTSSSILMGTFGAYFLLEQFETLEIPLMGLAIGSYLIVVFNDLIPHSLANMIDVKHAIRHIVFFVVGLGLMLSLGALLPHAEVESANEHTETRESILVQ